MPQNAPQLLLVEDDPFFADWVAQVLAPQFSADQLVHAAGRGAALAVLRTLPASCWTLAIVDLNLPDGSGVDVIRAIADYAPQAPILVVTAVEEPGVALAAIRAGASGYLVKATMDADLLRTVEQVQAGGSPITPAIARLLLLEFHEKKIVADLNAETDSDLSLSSVILQKITERETEVLRLLARGYGNKEIATRLGFSPNTADTHVRSIYRKLSVNSRAQLRSILAD
jgi:DNA-binding NarL/FixJ family response regulator